MISDWCLMVQRYSINLNSVNTIRLMQGFNSISTINWDSGLYFITISTEEGRITKRWFKI